MTRNIKRWIKSVCNNSSKRLWVIVLGLSVAANTSLIQTMASEIETESSYSENTRKLESVSIQSSVDVASDDLEEDEISVSAVIGNDYPYRNHNYLDSKGNHVADKWAFYKRECTSFVAWCLNSRNGISFSNYYKGVKFGNASNWGNAAKSIGIPVDKSPAVGSVAWRKTGNHVAWVAEVNGNDVTVEEYEGCGGDHGYHTRTKTKSYYDGFIHFNDVPGEPPVIQDVKVENITRNGYDISCVITGGSATSVKFPTWTIYRDQDDLKWSEGSLSGGRWKCHISVSEHNNETGDYVTDVYAYYGNNQCVTGQRTSVYIDRTNPSIKNIKIENVTKDGYDVSCIVEDNGEIDRVEFPTWTTQNDQDDITWERGSYEDGRWNYHVDVAKHGSEEGDYVTHIYAYDKAGNSGSGGADIVFIDRTPPTVTNAKVSNLKWNEYDISAVVTDRSEIKYAQYIIWGKDSNCLSGYGLYKDGKYSIHVNTTQIETEDGAYLNGILVEDIQGNYQGIYLGYVHLPKDDSGDDGRDDPGDETDYGDSPAKDVFDEDKKPDNDIDEESKSGTCGTSMTWTLDSNGKLEITGTGKMYDYDLTDAGYNPAPWVVDESTDNWRGDEIKSLVVKEGVTYIGETAFSRTAISNVSLPEGISIIPYRAFSYCESITSFNVPKGVNTIDEWAFRGCTKLESVVLPKSLTSIEYAAFEYCNNIKDVYFEGTEAEWKSISIASNNENIISSAKIHFDYGEDEKDIPGIEKGETEYKKKVGDEFDLEHTVSGDGDIEYFYDPTPGNEVIYLDDNHVKCLKVGVAKVTLSANETKEYSAVEYELQITVTEKDSSDSEDSDDDHDDDSDKDDKEDKTKYYKVYFVSNGGSDTPSQKVEDGDHVEEPSNPIKSGFVFVGWYADKELTTKWDFDANVVHSDITLYAKWGSEIESAFEKCVLINGDVVSYNGIRYYMAGTKVSISDIFSDAGSVDSSDKSIAKVSKKGVVTFKKNGNVTLTSDKGKTVSITVFGKKPEKVTIHVGDTYTIPDEVMIETLGNLRYSNASKVAVSDDGKITALSKGTVKVKYTQSGKSKIVLKLKITK